MESTHDRLPLGAVGRAIRTRPITAFLALTWAISGTCFALTRVLPGAQSPDRFPGGLVWLPMVWSPNLAAAVVTWVRGDLLSLVARFRPARLPPAVWAAALLPLGVLASVASVRGAHWERVTPGLLLALSVLHLLLGPLGEEAGWRGFLQTELDRRHGRLRATLLVGALWAFWHLPLWSIDSPQAQIPFPLFAAHVFCYAFVMSALLWGGRGNLVPVVVFHWLVNATIAVAGLVDLAPAATWFGWTLPVYGATAFGAWNLLRSPAPASAREGGRWSGRFVAKFAVGLGAAFAAGALWAYTFAPRRVPPVVDARDRAVPDHVAAIEFPEIGGVSQAVVLRGRSERLPLALFVHGGPGTPETPMLFEFVPELSDHLLLASWEQRGSGLSFSRDVPPETLTLESLTRDLHEVSTWLLERYDRDQLLLVAHSWGTVLALRAVAERPERYAAYVGIGQVADPAESERAIYDWAVVEARLRRDEKALRELTEIGAPRAGDYREGVEGRMRLARWITRWGGSIYGRSDLLPYVWAVAKTPVYRMRDRINYLRGESFSLSHLWTEMQSYDLTREVRRVEVPVVMVQGKHDRQTPCAQAWSYFEQLEAPWKQFFVFDDSAHSPLFEEPERFVELLQREVLPLAPEAG